MRLQPGDVVQYKTGERCWVVLYCDAGFNRPTSGLYGLGGMWYGDDPLNAHHYGKITPLVDDVRRIGRIRDYPLATLKRMVS